MRLFCKLIVSLMALVAVGCSEVEPVVVHSLTLSEGGVVFDSEGGQKSVVVTPFPEDMAWSLVVAEPKEWYGVEVEGTNVVVTVSPNTQAIERTALFEIVSPTGLFDTKVVTVSQEAGRVQGSIATSAAESYEFDSMGGDYTFTVYAEDEWSVECSADWISVDTVASVVTLSAAENSLGEQRSATVSVKSGTQSVDIAVSQQTHSQNGYLKLLGQWEITATKWFYSPNGSLNELDYNPNQKDYYLIFKMEQGEYGKTLIMKDFLYPGTSLEVEYDSQSGGIVIPFGWTVLSYDVFLYITLINSNKFSFASLEVAATPSEDHLTLTLVMPAVAGFDYVGFGLWTYNDNGSKVAFGYRSQPTMFPMGRIVFRKYTN